jgi:hypothetical protein
VSAEEIEVVAAVIVDEVDDEVEVVESKRVDA